MVPNTGEKANFNSSRSLNEPKSLEVMTGSENMPYKIRIRGIWKSVTGIQDICRIDDEWWREKPISRIYYMCILKTEEAVVIFQDLITNSWYRQFE